MNVPRIIAALVLVFLFALPGCGNGPSSNEGSLDQDRSLTDSTVEPARVLQPDSDLALEFSRHDGTVVEANSYYFELVPYEAGIRLYGYDPNQDRLSLKETLGSVHVRTEQTRSDHVPLRFHPDQFTHQEEPGPGYLQAHDRVLVSPEGDAAELVLRITGLPDRDKPLEFRVVRAAVLKRERSDAGN